MNDEIFMIEKMKIWEPECLPEGRKYIRSECILNRELGSFGKYIRYWARLVAKSVSQKPGVDYEEVFELVYNYTSLRFLLALKVLRKYRIPQLDVNRDSVGESLRGST